MLAHIPRSLIHSPSTPLFTEGRALCHLRGITVEKASLGHERATLTHHSHPSKQEGKAKAQGGSGSCARLTGRGVGARR